MSDHNHHKICSFYGVDVFADCDEKKAQALARVLERCQVRSDLKIDSILEEAGLKEAPAIKHEEPKPAVQDKNRRAFADRPQMAASDEAKEVAKLEKAKAKHEDVAPRAVEERDPPREDPKATPVVAPVKGNDGKVVGQNGPLKG